MESFVRRRINELNDSKRSTLLKSIELIYWQCKELNTDEFTLDAQKRVAATDNREQMSAENIVAIVYEYHDCKKPINVIMKEKSLTTFDVISALCEYVFKQQGTIFRLVDFTEAIRYMYVEQIGVIQLIDFLLANPNADLTTIIAQLSCLPSLCLLSITLVWIELKNPKMGDLFEKNWSNMTYNTIGMNEFKRLDDELQKIFDEFVGEKMACNAGALPCEMQLSSFLQMTREVANDRQKVLDETMQSLQELEQILKNKAPYVETVLSDSSDSDTVQENDEICVITQKVSAKWLATSLTHELLEQELVIKKLNFYLTKTATFMESSKMMEIYTHCKFVDMTSGDGYVMQMMQDSMPTRDVALADLAMTRAPSVRCPEGTRVVALLQRNVSSARSYWLPGTVGVKPLIQNNFEYLIFFDNGIDSYVSPENIRLKLEQPMDPTTQRFEPREAYTLVRNVAKQNFVRRYLQAFPDWPLIRLKKSENTMRVLTKRDGREESAYVLDVNRQMCLLRFPHQRSGPLAKAGRECVVIDCSQHEHIDEWIYRGNSDRFPTLLCGTERPIDSRSSACRLGGRARSRFEMALPEYDPGIRQRLESIDIAAESTMQGRGIQTARKSSRRQVLEISKTMNMPTISDDLITRRRLSNKLRYDEHTTPNWSHLKYTPHERCSSKCNVDVRQKLNVEKYQPCSPHFIPLLLGWTREIRKTRTPKGENIRLVVVYRAPCGMRFVRMKSIASHLQATGNEYLTIDLFSFDIDLRPHIIARPGKDEWVLMNDFARGLEDVAIPVVNAVDSEKVPSMIYRARRFADSSVIDGSLQPQFCSGCSCTDNCSDPNKCECQQLTIIANDRLSTSLQVTCSKLYQNRTLSEKIISGMYECNDMCSCSKKLCYNRVVQQNIKIPLQLYMTAETGWGVRTLVDIPAGSFISTYSGRLLTDRMAELQGREVSDMYLAELDLYEAVEAEKQQQGIDLIDADYDEGIGTEDEMTQSDTEKPSTSDVNIKHEQESSAIDEQLAVLRPPNVSQFDFNMYFGDNALFIVDAQESGNIGRFLNHCCDPNVFVQMVLVDTHDLRLPWVAFFAQTFVKAGEELRWNYGYSPNSVPGKVLMCKCGSTHCQGRLL